MPVNSPSADDRPTASAVGVLATLRLTLTPGMGPILIRRCVEAFGSAEGALGASASALRQVKGIGETKGDVIRRGLDASDALAREELELAQRLKVTLVTPDDADYPPLLKQLDDRPALLYVRGRLDAQADRHCIAIVGSRSCTQYGLEQAERFSAMLAESGLTVVSGGARGVDTAAHRAALRVSGRTIVVMGCGLSHCYPPENAELFSRIVGTHAEADAEALGAVVSELPLRTPPVAENFPARNRIISGMALGVLVVEAARGSGALITAKAAAEDQGREVFAVPGRVDSGASEGSNDLIKHGGAALVTIPADVLDALEKPARYLHDGVHDARYAASATSLFGADRGATSDMDRGPREVEAKGASIVRLEGAQKAIFDALDQPRSIDELAAMTGVSAGELLAAATSLEVRRLVVRQGPRLSRRAGSA